MSRFLMSIFCVVFVTCYSGEINNNASVKSINDDKYIYELVVNYSTAVTKKDYALYLRTIYPAIYEFYKEKKLLVLQKEIGFIQYLYSLELAHPESILSVISKDHSNAAFYLSDIQDFPEVSSLKKHYSFERSGEVYGKDINSIKVLNVYLKNSPNDVIRMPIVYSEQGAYLAFPVDLLMLEQEKYQKANE